MWKFKIERKWEVKEFVPPHKPWKSGHCDPVSSIEPRLSHKVDIKIQKSEIFFSKRFQLVRFFLHFLNISKIGFTNFSNPLECCCCWASFSCWHMQKSLFTLWVFEKISGPILEIWRKSRKKSDSKWIFFKEEDFWFLDLDIHFVAQSCFNGRNRITVTRFLRYMWRYEFLNFSKWVNVSWN